MGDPAPMEPGGSGEVGEDEELAIGGELRVRFLFLPIIRRLAECTEFPRDGARLFPLLNNLIHLL